MIIIFKGIEYDTDRDYEAEEKKLREDAMKKLSSYITNASSCYINLTGTINQFGNAVGNIRGGRHIIISG